MVALSGGPDSAVAGWLATTRSDRVRAVFVDHGWPGSTVMSAAAHDVAAHLGIPIVVVPVEPTHSETQARVVRLQALEQEAGGEPVVTGHHAGDVAETVLANLLRGAGATGLSGIPATRPPFVRPLLAVPAAEVRRVAVELGLPFADDPANGDPGHHRNHIRHIVLAGLEQDAPGAAAALARSASMLGADDASLERLAADVPLHRDGGAVSIPAGILATIPRPSPPASAGVRCGWRIHHTRGRRQMSPGSWRRSAAAPLSCPPDCSPPGKAPSSSFTPPPPGRRYRPADPGPRPGRDHCRRIVAALVDLPAVPPLGTGVAWLAPAIGDLTVTGAVPGDRIDLGGGHSRKVTDLLADAGVPRRRRPGWPVVVAHGKIAWLVGARVGAWARPGAADPRVIELRWT